MAFANIHVATVYIPNGKTVLRVVGDWHTLDYMPPEASRNRNVGTRDFEVRRKSAESAPRDKNIASCNEQSGYGNFLRPKYRISLSWMMPGRTKM
jgi:hypothetical protein